MPGWFLYVNGVALFVIGLALLRTRPRRPDDGLYRRYINLGTLWALLCCAVGVALCASAAGYFRVTAPSPPPLTAPERPPWRS